MFMDVGQTFLSEQWTPIRDTLNRRYSRKRSTLMMEAHWRRMAITAALVGSIAYSGFIAP